MRILLRAGLVLGLVTAACGEDSVGPKSLGDPQTTTAELAALATLFDSEVLASFSTVSWAVAPAGPAPATALALADAANPLTRSSVLRPYAGRIESARLLGRLMPNLSTTSAAAIFPPEVAGKTFEWNTTNAQYEPTARTGAPSDGVRFILYAIDPLAGAPADPLVEVGYIDLDDESTGSTPKLHVTIAGVGGTPTYVDYTVTLASVSSSSARITTSGYITNGAASPDSLRFNGTITGSGTATTITVTQEFSLDVNSHDVHVRSWQRVTLTETTTSLRIAFRFEHGNEVVTLDGTFDVDDFAGTVSGTLSARVDGGAFATCSVEGTSTSYTLTCEGADADGLNAAEAEALQAMGDAFARFAALFEGLLGPPLGLLAA